MKWQVFVRAGINNTSEKANNDTNGDVVAVTNSIRAKLEDAGLAKRKKPRKTATYRGEFQTTADVKKVCSAIGEVLVALADLEGDERSARLDNVWLLINREDDAITTADDEKGDEVEEVDDAEEGE